MDKEHPIQMLPGIGPNRAARLQKLGIETADDLLRWFPRQYEDRRTVYPVEGAPVGEKCCVSAVVVETPRTSRITKGREVTRLRAADDTGVLNITFFGQSYVRTALQVGQSYVFYGTIEGTQRRKGMTNPIFEPEHRRQDTGRIMPIYPLTAGISNHLLASAVAWCLEQPWAEWPEDLPQTIRQRYQLATRTYAVRIAHFPPSWEELAIARRRLVFEELFYFSIGLALLRQRRTEEEGIRCASGDLRDFYALLPFQLTGAQRRAAEDAARDLTRGVPMNRLLQGDVGSGKTVVGAACVWLMAQSGYQSALMAPTEILAQQHAQTLQTMLAPSGIRVGLLTGSLRAAEKRKIYDAMATGAVDLVVGTHALLTDQVTFANLGLVITDEQHRFGVNQRAALAQKGKGIRPHVLVMSATPIPRTLALLLYGDLEVSIIDELPSRPTERGHVFGRGSPPAADVRFRAQASPGGAPGVYGLSRRGGGAGGRPGLEGGDHLRPDLADPSVSRPAGRSAPREDEGEGQGGGHDRLRRRGHRHPRAPPPSSRWAWTCPGRL